MNNSEVFIFTEAYNCASILKKSIESFYKYHNHKVHIFGRTEDFQDIKELDIYNIIFIDLSLDEKLKSDFENGHLGTANIFAKVIKKEFGEYNNVIHFDSDVIFRGECLSDILNSFDEGYDLIGQRRPYKNNIANNDGRFNDTPDVIGTCFFGVKVNKISDYNFSVLQQMICGYYNPFGFNAIDFFDPISFDIINNGGRIKFLDFKDYGSCDENGDKDNGFLFLNNNFDFGNKFIHFAGIGSGKKFFEKGRGSVPSSYADWAIKRYGLYMKLLYDDNKGIEYEKNILEEIKKVL